MKTKKCNGCGQVKPKSEFSLKPCGNAQGRCKPCHALYQRQKKARQKMRKARSKDTRTILQRYRDRREQEKAA